MTDQPIPSNDDEDDDDWWSEVWDGPTQVTGVRPHTAHLRPCLLASAALLVPAAAVGWAIAGTRGAVAAPSAVLTVAAFFTVSVLAVAWADKRNPQLTLPVALSTYLAKVWFFGVVAFAAARGDGRWHGVFAGALGVGIAAWLGAHVWWFLRTPSPRVERVDAPHDTPASPTATKITNG